MSLSCSCDFDGDYDWYFYAPDDYSTLETSHRKRCSSCNTLVDIGSTIARFECYRQPKWEVEISIYGEDGEIPIADKILCEECADIYFSLYELGFECISPTENMRGLAIEHKETQLENRKLIKHS